MTDAAWRDRPMEMATRASGLLRAFNRARVLEVPELQIAQRVSWLAGASEESVQLALAFVVRALRLGSVCVTLASLRSDVERSLEEPVADDLPWPDPEVWTATITQSSLVSSGDTAPGERPLRLVDGQLYLERSWQQQEDVRRDLRARAAAEPPTYDEELLEISAASLFDGRGLAPGEVDLQRLAAEQAVRHRILVLAGGPGTGKTTTVARLLALLALQHGRVPQISLAAPSGKAAARLQEAVRTEVSKLDGIPAEYREGLAGARGVTVHRLLGAVPGGAPRRNATNPVAAEVVVIDETSMVSLSQMSQLLAAVRPDARLVLVGDPDQLASIDAGAVLADITSAVESRQVRLPHVRLRHTWRYGGAIGELADAVRTGDQPATLAILGAGLSEVRLVALDDVGALSPVELEDLRAEILPVAKAALEAAVLGDAPTALRHLRRHRVLCAHRSGPQNTSVWNRQIERWLVSAVAGHDVSQERYPGQPLLVTRNDPDLGISNGDNGIVIRTEHGLRAALDVGATPLLFAPAQLDSVETVHAMTVHKAQGSQFDGVTVVLPMPGSPLLTRELLYTAITRAAERVTIVAHPQALEQAVTRQALRASGLRTRL